MAYIEAHQSLRDHRKILALAADLDMPEPHVAGHCLYLWLWSLDNAPEGVLPMSGGRPMDVQKPDVRIIEKAAGWSGGRGDFVAAMVRANMLDEDENGVLRIHDWMDYAGRLIEKRKSDAERKRRERSSTPRPPDIPRTSRGHPRDGAGTVPNRTVENPTKRENARAQAKTSVIPTTPSLSLSPIETKETKIPDQLHKLDGPLFEALVEALGKSPATESERASWDEQLRQLADIQASRDDILARCALYRQRYPPPFAFTPKAVVRHWSELDPASQNGANTNGHVTASHLIPQATLDSQRADRDRLAEEKRRLAADLHNAPELAAYFARGKPDAG